MANRFRDSKKWETERAVRLRCASLAGVWETEEKAARVTGFSKEQLRRFVKQGKLRQTKVYIRGKKPIVLLRVADLFKLLELKERSKKTREEIQSEDIRRAAEQEVGVHSNWSVLRTTEARAYTTSGTEHHRR